MGGSNQSLFLIGALIAGQGGIPGQGSAAIPLLILGLLLSWAAAFGWTELILMWPNRVGGIAATCAEAFRPISPVLANLTGVCYWWGWVPTCGLTAILSATAIHQWYLPHVPVPLLASALVLTFMCVNLCGIHWVTRMVIPIATASATLAFLSGFIPILTGHVNWQQATTFHLTVPFTGLFGKFTSAMAGLYLIGFAAPAFEAAACHVGETVDPVRNVPRAMFASAAMATVYFVLLPIVWLGVIGPAALSEDLQNVLGPTFAPLLGSVAKATAIWFMMLNMFHGTIAPLAGAARTLSQLSEDGLLPRILARRSRTDCPWVSTVLTATMSIAFLLIGDPIWMIAGANLTYLISICMPSVAVWLLRRDAPEMSRPYRAPRFTVELGLAAAIVWGISAILGFQQFGLPTVLFGMALAYSGSLLYAYRRWRDRKRSGEQIPIWSLHTKLTGAMLVVLMLDSAGYYMAVRQVNQHHIMLITVLQDIFVAVALLSITVGLVLPGMVAHAAAEVARSAHRLATGTLADFSRAMQALGKGDLDDAYARLDISPLAVRSRDEMGLMTQDFNLMQAEVAHAAEGLAGAREGLRRSRNELTDVNTALAETNTELKHRVEELRQSRERFELAVQGSKDGIWDWEITTGLTYFSPRLKSMLGLGDSEQEDHPEEWVDLLHPDDREQVLASIRTYLEEDVHQFEQEFRFRHPDGSYSWILGRGVIVRNPDGVPYRMTGSATDITERKASEQLLVHQALHDGLTGLPNRSLLRDRLAQAIRAADRNHTTFALLLMDLDRFKEINDTFGHSYGDLLLQQLKPRLQGVVRSIDTVARLGGDEFACVLPETDEAGAKDAAQKILAVLEEPFALEDYRLNVEMSIGIALYPEHGMDIESLLRRADVAMYVAKHVGSRCGVYDPAEDNNTAKRLSLIGDLRHALGNDEFMLYFQPKVELATGAVVAVEALIRWRHPEHGFLLPSEFVPLAEQTGLVEPLSRWVLDATLRQLSVWQQRGYDLRMAVNLSARNLQDGNLPRVIKHLLRTHGVSSSSLVLEITESAVMDNPGEAIANLYELHRMGVLLSIDDFGTGYSSLTYLKKMPVHEVKIDQSFVRDMVQNVDDATIVRSIVDLGHNLGLRVVAEGVESQADYDLLVAIGCDMAQGYFISPPLPADRFVSWLSEHRLAIPTTA
jgi:diguanylate cyclase (GGDEF)-like protein/PAS domain S-box-containing protein